MHSSQKTEHQTSQPPFVYEYWRTRILYSTMLGYIFFYFIRKNISMAMPLIEESDLGISKTDLGIFLTLHGILYGVSRFAHGIAADRANPRYFMAAGLFLCALANFAFGMSSTVWCMGIFWVLNGWFQGMGFPPCAKSLTHWFAAEERGVKFAIWNTSHSIGAGIVFLLNSVIIWYFHDWRFCFFIPAAIAICGAVMLIERLRDSPEKLGLAPIEKYYASRNAENREQESLPTEELIVEEAEKPESLGETLWKHVYSNPWIWALSFANFFVYVVRFSILDWAPTFLKEAKGIEVHHAGLVSCGYELVAVLGMLSGGYLMDRVFRGRGSKVCFLAMFCCTITLAYFWWSEPSNFFSLAILLSVIGFFIYVPQCLIGVIVANVATKKAAAAANGLTGIFGYLSVTVSGAGVAFIAKNYGWNAVFAGLIGASGIAMLLFLFALNAVSPEQLATEKKERNSEK